MEDCDVTEGSLVSIVLPTYNRAKVLPYAIRSVLEQTYSNLELVIVDDNSPDNTREVVASFDDARIRYVRNDPNLKLPKALNRGFSMAQGAYLSWTSDDNMFEPTAVEKMVRQLQKQDCDFIYADYYLFSQTDSDGVPLDVKHDRLPDTVRLETGNHIGACFMYTRRLYEAIGEYDPELFLVEDYDYFIRASKQFKFCHIGEPLYYFRRDDDTLYCSRLCEVKASDFLVRFKNGLLDEGGVVDAMLDLLMRHPGQMKNPLLGTLYLFLEKTSYRLAKAYRKLLAKYLSNRLAPDVHSVLELYRSGGSSFGEVRDRLCNRMQKISRIEYVKP